MKDPCKIIGHNLRILRDALGITQMEAARRIDISVSGYREIERGNANPTLRTVELIADGMGVPPLALIKEPWIRIRFNLSRPSFCLPGRFPIYRPISEKNL